MFLQLGTLPQTNMQAHKGPIEAGFHIRTGYGRYTSHFELAKLHRTAKV